MHEGHEPDALGDLLDADVLAGEDGAQVDLARPKQPCGPVCCRLWRSQPFGLRLGHIGHFVQNSATIKKEKGGKR